jgi:DNA-binding IscR family transcriptional regulator
MFSQTVEYALRAIVHLAKLPEVLQTTAQIAKATQVPAPYLSKVLQTLTRE